MAMAVASPTTLRMERVLFAEASKEVVDFLFSLLALPVGTVVMQLGQDAVVGSVGGLYSSVENLKRSYAQPGVDMDALLRPVVPPPAAGSVSSLLQLPAVSARSRCPSCGGRPPQAASRKPETTYNYSGGGARVPTLTLSQVMAKPASATGGFVQGNMTYTVMDDLAIAPMSTISSISVFNTMAVRDLAAVQERTVQLGYMEALKILTVHVFLLRRAPAPAPAPAMLAR